MNILINLLLLITSWVSAPNAPVYLTQEGTIKFKSDAPLEMIEATSNELKGAVDGGNNTFAFTVEINSFKGFNSPLQLVHFNENYMESKTYPKATFIGKIIEEVDLNKPGEQTIRAKGKLTVHGIEQERIIKSTISVSGNVLKLTSNFTVILQDHNITIPRIVHQKIAEEIQVQVSAELKLQP